MKSFGLKVAFMVCAVGLLVAAGGTLADAALTMDYDDMWDVTSPHTGRVAITSAGPGGLIFPAERSFGHTSGSGDGDYNTIFNDGYAAGTVHYVEWTCADPVTLAEFHLFASRDWIYDHWSRQFSAFNLYYYQDTGGWQLIKHLDTDTLYGQYDPTQPGFLAVSVSDFSPVTGQMFRYEVVQTANPQYGVVWSGPRVCELDGYSTTAIPLPGAIWLLASGLLGLGGCAWRRHS